MSAHEIPQVINLLITISAALASAYHPNTTYMSAPRLYREGKNCQKNNHQN